MAFFFTLACRSVATLCSTFACPGYAVSEIGFAFRSWSAPFMACCCRTLSPCPSLVQVAIKMLIKSGEKYNQELEEVRVMTVWAERPRSPCREEVHEPAEARQA